jgi:hypothetical protein
MAYRDDRGALESRRDDLRRELDDIESKVEALREVVRNQASVERELAETEVRLARLDARRLSLLDDVRVASPCNASWEAMTGDERVRFCLACGQNVYNLSALTYEEAIRLLAEREGSICVRLYRREDGTTLTADCPVGARRKRVRLPIAGAVGASVLAGAALWSATMVTMGKMPMPAQHHAKASALLSTGESYVRQPLRPNPAPGLVFLYERDPQPGRPDARWMIWADGRAARVNVGGRQLPDAALDVDAMAAVQEILSLSRELSAEGTGAVPEYGDSAVPRRYELFGTGKREATDADRARLFRLAERLAPGGDDP